MDINVNFNVELSLKNFPKEIVDCGCAKDCASILIADALKKVGYDCEVSKINIKYIGG